MTNVELCNIVLFLVTIIPAIVASDSVGFCTVQET